MFYSALYQSQIIQSDGLAEFLQGMPVISESAQTESDRPVTKGELYAALCSLTRALLGYIYNTAYWGGGGSCEPPL